jgi:hypothetical protein
MSSNTPNIEYNEGAVEYGLQLLALESGIVDNAVSLLRSVLPDFITNLTSKRDVLENAAKTKVMDLHGISDKDAGLVVGAVKADFINYADRIIVVPERFTGNYLEYTRITRPMVTEYYTLLDNILDEYSIIVSSFITNSFARVSLKEHDDYMISAKNFLSEREEIVHKFFQGKNDISRVRMKDVVANTPELNSLFLEQNLLVKSINKIDLKQLQRKVEKIVSLLGIVYKELEENKTNKVSGNVAKNIGDGSFIIARAVEAYVLLYYDALKLKNAIKETMELLKRK